MRVRVGTFFFFFVGGHVKTPIHPFAPGSNIDGRTFTPAMASVGGNSSKPRSKNWTLWDRTCRALLQTYYVDGMTEHDEHYALAALTRFATSWHELHEHRQTPQPALDHATAEEVFYHWYRARQFRRPIAALAVCWVALISERPERIINQEIVAKKRAQAKPKP